MSVKTGKKVKGQRLFIRIVSIFLALLIVGGTLISLLGTV